MVEGEEAMAGRQQDSRMSSQESPPTTVPTTVAVLRPMLLGVDRDDLVTRLLGYANNLVHSRTWCRIRGAEPPNDSAEDLVQTAFQKYASPTSGKCIWLTSEDGASFYYAHLDQWEANIHEGREVKRGDLLAYAEASMIAPMSRSVLHFAAHGVAEWDGLSKACGAVPASQANADASLPWDGQIRSQ